MSLMAIRMKQNEIFQVDQCRQFEMPLNGFGSYLGHEDGHGTGDPGKRYAGIPIRTNHTAGALF
jgi:hypothetical protein